MIEVWSFVLRVSGLRALHRRDVGKGKDSLVCYARLVVNG